MKIIAVGAVTAGGKTTAVRELARRLKNAKALYFDDYTFPAEVEDFGQWAADGADYNVWDLSPLAEDVRRIRDSGEYDYLLLDYPFAYCHSALREVIDYAFFIDTPLDIAMARRVLRDMKDASGDDIRNEMAFYLRFARAAYVQALKDVLPSSDCVIDGTRELTEEVDEMLRIIRSL